MAPQFKRPAFAFNESASKRSEVPETGLTYAIRTDADFSTRKLKKHIHDAILENPDHPLYDFAAPEEGELSLAEYIKSIMHTAYQVWGHDILTAKARYLDYTKYDVGGPDEETLDIHFYNAHALTRKAIHAAKKQIKQDPAIDSSLPVFFISLDDMIQKQESEWADVGFSRLFDLTGRNHFGYTGRPGLKSLDEQINIAKAKIAALSEKHGQKIPVVLLEDNVRQAKMLNWVIDKLDDKDFFEHAHLSSIATCFCCADDVERAAIQHEGRTIPLNIVIDYEQNKVDVCTPRDVMLDGFVVEVDGKKTRLPGIFMDVAARFKIRPDYVKNFRAEAMKANQEFCKVLEEEFEIDLPMSWFVGADAMAHVTGLSTDTPMRDVLKALEDSDYKNIPAAKPDAPAP
jgi:hypothetical protein